MDRTYTQINSEVWDRWSDNRCVWTIPISHEEYAAALSGHWAVYLTPCRPVPYQWFPPLRGARLLGLASGGGQQMPIFSALGAECTVFDNSEKQLDAERQVAGREGYPIRIVKGDMTQPLPFDDGSFDVVFHPVSNCYVEDVLPIWRECYRVLKDGGVLLAGFDNGLNFLFDDNGCQPLIAVNKLPYNPLRGSETEYRCMVRNDEGIQFSHSLEEQIGGQLCAGFRLTHLYEDRDREDCGLLREYAPQYIATRSIKEKG